MTAARRALDTGEVDVILPFVPEDGEDEVRSVFERVVLARAAGAAARDVADLFLFETVVRLHRAGEGAPYTGLKPSGLDVGPVIPLAEEAVETGSARAVAEHLHGVLDAELEHRLGEVTSLSATRDRSVPDARAHVEATLGFEVYCHHVLQALQAPAAHGDAEHQSGHTHG